MLLSFFSIFEKQEIDRERGGGERERERERETAKERTEKREPDRQRERYRDGVATISRILEILVLFCRISSLL